MFKLQTSNLESRHSKYQFPLNSAYHDICIHIKQIPNKLPTYYSSSDESMSFKSSTLLLATKETNQIFIRTLNYIELQLGRFLETLIEPKTQWRYNYIEKLLFPFRNQSQSFCYHLWNSIWWLIKQQEYYNRRKERESWDKRRTLVVFKNEKMERKSAKRF